MKVNVNTEKLFTDMEDGSADAVNQALESYLADNKKAVSIANDRNKTKKDLLKKSDGSKTL